MHIDAKQVGRFAKRTLREARDEFAPPPPSPPPYRQWSGPHADAQNSDPQLQVSATTIGDILLVQGVAPADASLTLEFGDGLAVSHALPVTHRFPHPDAAAVQADQRFGFEITVDASITKDAQQLRITSDSAATPWQTFDSLPSPQGMPGAERLDSCPACGHSEFTSAGRRQQLDMETCGRCGLVMTNPRPVEDHTLMRYSERYFQEEYLPSQQPSTALDAHLDQILDQVEPARAYRDTLFELGVGGGNLLDRARSRGWNVAGTDVNEASVNHAKGRGLRVWHENVDHAQDLGGSYGAIISEMSIEHIRRPDYFCRLAAEALVPGGRLLIYTVSGEGASFTHSGMGSPLVGPAEHLFLFSADSLVQLCSQAGLRVDSLWRSPSGDEIGLVAVKRTDVGNPAIPNS